MNRLIVALAALATVATLAGCTILAPFIGEQIEPEYDIRDRLVLVPAFRDGRQGHYESRRGDAVSSAVALQFQKEGGCQLVSDHKIEDGIVNANYPEPTPWSQLGREAGADFVVLGWLRSVKITDGTIIGMLQGTAEVRVDVWDSVEDRVVHTKTFTTRFPEDTNKEVTAVFEITEDELERKLLSRVALRISKLYCGEYKRH